jgi:hypothetical protein
VAAGTEWTGVDAGRQADGHCGGFDTADEKHSILGMNTGTAGTLGLARPRAVAGIELYRTNPV